MALALDRRTSANLNYTVSSDVMNACIKLAGIKHVLTSRKFMDKMDFKEGAVVRKLTRAGKPDVVGDQSANFETSEPFKFLAPQPK